MKPKERVQELFGEAVIRMVREFAARDVEPSAMSASRLFGHISDPKVRDSLAEVYYGCRWILKVAVALQSDNDERKAMARWQVIDFASVSECLLLECCKHGLQRSYFSGQAHRFQDPPTCQKPLKWHLKPPGEILERRSALFLVDRGGL